MMDDLDDVISVNGLTVWTVWTFSFLFLRKKINSTTINADERTPILTDQAKQLNLISLFQVRYYLVRLFPVNVLFF